MPPVSFPFELLHSTIVEYCKESEARRNQVKEEWKKVADTCADPNQIENCSALIHQAFAHNRAVTQLEAIGFRVGYVLAEKLSKDSARLNSELEIVKFICKDFWVSAFGKQVDNLRTNHQGVYVVQDNKLCMVSSFSEGSQFIEECVYYLAFPSGVVRGALSNLGINSVVTPTVECLPAVKFHIQVQQK